VHVLDRVSGCQRQSDASGRRAIKDKPPVRHPPGGGAVARLEVSIAVEWLLTTSRAATAKPPSTTCTPAPRNSGDSAQAAASARLRGPSKSGDEPSRIAPVTMTGLSERTRSS